MEYALAIIGGYLLGSIPFGLVLTRMAGYGDIRNIGSGNIGATNVLRTGNKGLALATLILDSSKGAIAVIGYHIFFRLVFLDNIYAKCDEAEILTPTIRISCDHHSYMWELTCIAGLFAVIGHLFPVWLKFKGGKGVATTFGTLLALKPVVGLAACGIWLLVAAITRYSSLSALVAVAAAPAVAHYLYGDANFTALCGVIATLVWIKHRANIQRLVKGEEPKIGKKK